MQLWYAVGIRLMLMTRAKAKSEGEMDSGQVQFKIHSSRHAVEVKLVLAGGITETALYATSTETMKYLKRRAYGSREA